MRKFLLPDPEHILYEFDLNQAEARIVAYIAPEPLMIRVFERGDDIHKLTASWIFNKPPEEISDIPGSCNLAGGKYSERYLGKKSNHAFNYKLGYKSFALELEITEREAKRIRDIYFRAYPGVSNYHRWIINELSKTRSLTNLFGLTRKFAGYWGDDLFRIGYSYIPQSSVPQIINDWGIVYIWENQDIFRPIKLISQVHDSLVHQISLNIPIDEHIKMLKLIKKNLEQPLHWQATGNDFIIPVELKMSTKNWASIKKVDLNNDDNMIKQQIVNIINWENQYGK